MRKRLVLTALALLIPTLACAGLVNIYVTTGSGSGSATRGGYFATPKFVSFSSNGASGYVLQSVTNNGATVATTKTSPTHWGYTVPLTNATQTVQASFYNPPTAATDVLVAYGQSAVNVSPGIPTTFSGQQSTVKYAKTPIYTFTSNNAGITFSPATGSASNPLNIVTQINATSNVEIVGNSICGPEYNFGPYTGTLVITDPATGATSAPFNFTINLAGIGIFDSTTCLVCHCGWPQTASWAASIHANSSHSTCQACHQGNPPNPAAEHPFDVTTATVSPTSFLTMTTLQGTGETSSVPLATNTTFCTACHTGAYPIPHLTTIAYGLSVCVACHTPTGTGDAHNIQPVTTTGGSTAGATSSCVGCHAQLLNSANPNLVHDNAGVRTITGSGGEFGASTRTNIMGYRSHHIYNGTNVDPQDAQCIACHLEGMAGPGRTVVVDPTNHVVDGKVHLRSGNTAIASNANVVWNPAAPNYTNLDNFCMSCHNASGAVTAYANMSSALYGMTPVANALPLSATNPFGDALTNAYDQKVRPAVVDVYSQFATTNPSHHAVRGQRYSGRTRVGAPAATRSITNTALFTQYSGAASADIHLNNNGNPTASYNTATHLTTFTQPVLTAYKVFGAYSTSSTTAYGSGFGPKFPGSRQTIYDSGFFVATYTTLNGNTLGDDSTLHCADCHSVGQYTSGSAQAITWNNHSTASNGYTVVATTAVVGAHGSQNDYMLRTSNGSDSLQIQSSNGAGVRLYTNGTYVCFLCHIQQLYGDNEYVKPTVLGTNAQPGTYEHGGGMEGNNGFCNSNANSGYGKTGTARYGVLISGTAKPSMGNIFGMTCAHCHNSGNQVFGGIHGATSTYISYSTNGLDVAGSTRAANDANQSAFLLNVTQKPSYRFMGGVSQRYNGGATPAKWESQGLDKTHREGCYNISATTDATHMWNTTNPQTTAAGGTNAVVNNGGNDSAWGASDYSYRTATNNATSGWGSCNHHQGSTTTGPTFEFRIIQRPLVY